MWSVHDCVLAGHLAHGSTQVQLEQDAAPWLAYEGKWGSTVEAPALQEWFARAENPVSRSWLAQVSRAVCGSRHACVLREMDP